jgi:hypothetical protein
MSTRKAVPAAAMTITITIMPMRCSLPGA